MMFGTVFVAFFVEGRTEVGCFLLWEHPEDFEIGFESSVCLGEPLIHGPMDAETRIGPSGTRIDLFLT